MIKFLITLILLNISLANAGTITDPLCGVGINCLVCEDGGTFAKCDDRFVFDKDILISTTPEIYGGTNTSIIKQLCPLKKNQCVNRKENITIEVTKEYILELPFGSSANIYRNNELFKLLENKPMLINTYCDEYIGSGESGGFQWIPCTKTINRGKVITFAEPFYNCTTGDSGGCDWDMVKPAIKTLTTSSSISLNIVDNQGAVQATWQEKTPFQTFCWEFVGSSESGGHTFVPCVKEVVDGLQWSFTPELEGTFISSKLVGNKFTVVVAKPVERNNYECPTNVALPCVEDSGSYYCSPKACGTIVEDGDTNTSVDDLTPKDDGATGENGECLENFYLFPGKFYDCKKASKIGIQPDCCLFTKTPEEIKDKLIKGATALYLAFPIFSPVFLSVFQDVFGELMGAFINNCSESELQLSTMRTSYGTDGNCHYLGDVCWEYQGASGSFMGNSFDNTFCNRRRSVLCCYDSVVAKAFNMAARKQLGIGWGTVIYKEMKTQYIPPQPNCRGLTLDEMFKLNLNDPDISNEMRAYFNQVVLKNLQAPGGALDPAKIINMQDKLIKDIENQYK